MVWKDSVLQILGLKDDFINKSISMRNGGDYRTAPATQGLLKISGNKGKIKMEKKLGQHFSPITAMFAQH